MHVGQIYTLTRVRLSGILSRSVVVSVLRLPLDDRTAVCRAAAAALPFLLLLVLLLLVLRLWLLSRGNHN